MSLILNLGTAPAALPSVNIHSHGHKRGSQVDSTDGSGSDAAAPSPRSVGQNIFSTLLHSIERVIGVQLSAAPATTARSAVAAGSVTVAGVSASTAADSTVGSNVNVIA